MDGSRIADGEYVPPLIDVPKSDKEKRHEKRVKQMEKKRRKEEKEKKTDLEIVWSGFPQSVNHLPEEELALLVDFCQCELFGQVTNWLNQNMAYDIVAHVQALCRLFEGSITQALEAAPMEA